MSVVQGATRVRRSRGMAASRESTMTGRRRLLTIHKALGREFRAVAVVGLNDGQLPDFRARTQEEKLAELRTFYVAVTRPSRILLLTRAARRETRYGARPSDPSPFIAFIPR